MLCIPPLTQPCHDPVLNSDALQTPVSVCVCACVSVFSVCVEYICPFFWANIAVSTPLPNCFWGYWLIAVVTV